MALNKRYISNDEVCKVSFYLSSGVDADKVTLVGEFNNWDKNDLPMDQLKDGRWKTVVNLDAGREYQYRYLVDGKEWINDEDADKYVTHPYGGENSVVVT